MIQELYLKEALNIRKRYLGLTDSQRKEYVESFLENMSNLTQQKNDKLNILKDKINPGNVESIKNEVLKVITDFETESKELLNKLDNKTELSKLIEEQESLYRNIKQTYFDMSDDDIRKEIYEYLDKNRVN